MNAREFLTTMLQWADDDTLENLLSVPALEFLLPCPGLQWVQYVGNGCGKVDGRVVPFDGSKIEGVRCLNQEAVDPVGMEQEDFAESVADLVRDEISLAEDLERDTNVEPNEEDSPGHLSSGLI